MELSPRGGVVAPSVVTIETPALGDRSYLAHDGRVGVVVDAQRDFDRVLEAADDAGVEITHVLETHIHNDYVTGGHALAFETGAAYVVAADEHVEFDRVPARDGDTFQTGDLSVTALHTPGHTAHHLSFVLRDGGGEALAVFTGGSMLFGSVGRTDLLGAAQTEALTRAQYRSVRRLAHELPAATAVHPTHGFGSFCSAIETDGTESTIGDERRANVAVVVEDEEEFVARLTAGLADYPRYYLHMAPANRRGPGPADLSIPREVDPDEIRARIDGGEWVVDLRQRRAFAREHVSGTISVEYGDSFSTFLAWTIPWGTPLTLIADSPDALAGARRQLVRVGIDRLEGVAASQTSQLAAGRSASYEATGFAGLAAALGRDGGGIVALDVRRPDEWRAGHVTGAVHIPFWELESRVVEVPPGEVWVYCHSGYRSAIAASILDRAGRHPVLVDDEWPQAAAAGVPVTTELDR